MNLIKLRLFILLIKKAMLIRNLGSLSKSYSIRKENLKSLTRNKMRKRGFYSSSTNIWLIWKRNAVNCNILLKKRRNQILASQQNPKHYLRKMLTNGKTG